MMAHTASACSGDRGADRNRAINLDGFGISVTKMTPALAPGEPCIDGTLEHVKTPIGTKTQVSSKFCSCRSPGLLSSLPPFPCFSLRTLTRTSVRQLDLTISRTLGTQLMGTNAAGMGANRSVMLSLLGDEEIVTPLAPLDPRSFWIVAVL